MKTDNSYLQDIIEWSMQQEILDYKKAIQQETTPIDLKEGNPEYSQILKDYEKRLVIALQFIPEHCQEIDVYFFDRGIVIRETS